jgi:hypothetical protein
MRTEIHSLFRFDDVGSVVSFVAMIGDDFAFVCEVVIDCSSDYSSVGAL